MNANHSSACSPSYRPILPEVIACWHIEMTIYKRPLTTAVWLLLRRRQQSEAAS